MNSREMISTEVFDGSSWSHRPDSWYIKIHSQVLCFFLYVKIWYRCKPKQSCLFKYFSHSFDFLHFVFKMDRHCFRVKKILNAIKIGCFLMEFCTYWLHLFLSSTIFKFFFLSLERIKISSSYRTVDVVCYSLKCANS